MRIIRPDDNHNDDNDDEREPTPEDFSDIGDEVEDYLAHVIANVPPPDTDEPPYTVPGRADRPIGPKRPALHLVPTNDDPQQDDEPAVLDPEAAIEAGRSARARMVRGAAGASCLVVAAGMFAGWGESVAVTGPLAVYGMGWVSYLWWNAALRPSFPHLVTSVTDGIGRGVSGAFATFTAQSDSPEASTSAACSEAEVSEPPGQRP